MTDIATGDVWSFSTSSAFPITLSQPLVTGISTPFGIAIWQPASLPTSIPVAGLKGNNLRLADYLNDNAPSSVIALFSNLEGEALSKTLKSAAPTRNAFATFNAQTTQISLNRVLTDYLQFDRSQSGGNEMFACLDKRLTDIASLDIPANPTENCYTHSLWVSGFGTFTHQSAQNQSPSFKAGSGGIVAAYDYKRTPSSQPIGIGAAYAHTHIDEHGGAGDADVDQGDVFCLRRFLCRQLVF